MNQVIINNIHPSILESLRLLAQKNHRTLEEEIKAIVTLFVENEEINRQARFDAAWAKIDAARQQHMGKVFSDSADLLREDRQR